MRALVNPAYDPAAVPRPAPDAPAFHGGLPGYAPTPVRELRAGVWVKDESNRLGLPAFKILGASWAAECALREQDVRELLRSLEKNAEATKAVSDATRHVADATKNVADAVRSLKR